MDPIDTFANRLRRYRESRRMTLEELSKLVDENPQTLNRYELGQRVPKVDVANSIASKLGINPLWLQGYNVGMKSPAPQIQGAAAHLDLDNIPEQEREKAIEEYNQFLEYLRFKYTRG